MPVFIWIFIRMMKVIRLKKNPLLSWKFITAIPLTLPLAPYKNKFYVPSIGKSPCRCNRESFCR